MKYQAPEHITDAMMNGKAIDLVVVGAGGTGSALVGKLYQMHYLLKQLGGGGINLVLIDDDEVSPSNVGRQSFYDFDVNRSKSECLIERFNNFGDTNWKFGIGRVEADNLYDVLDGTDILITCVDNPNSRVEIGQMLEDTLYQPQEAPNLLWLDGGNNRNSGQVILGSYEHDAHESFPRLPSVYDLFGQQLETMEFKDTDSCSHEEAIAKQDFGVNDAVAHHMAQLIWKLLRYGEIEHHGVEIDLTTGTSTPMPIDPLTWEMYGFTDGAKQALAS